MPAKNIQAHDGSGIRAAVAEPPASPPKSDREPKSGERLQTPEETADFLRVSLSWLAKARMRGDGPPFVKIGRSIRYPESVLHHWMKSQMHLSTSER
jgi:hypothetical protein